MSKKEFQQNIKHYSLIWQSVIRVYLVHWGELQKKSTLIGRDLKCNEGDRTNANKQKQKGQKPLHHRQKQCQIYRA